MSFPPTVDPILLPPKIAVLFRSYLLTPMAPTPVMTRLPNPDDNADTINGALRLEEGGGVKANRFQYDMTCLLHGYSPDEDEANQITNDAIALAGAARAQTVDGWYVVGVTNVSVAQRRTDPDVILPHYLAFVTWRVAGQPWNP